MERKKLFLLFVFAGVFLWSASFARGNSVRRQADNESSDVKKQLIEIVKKACIPQMQLNYEDVNKKFNVGIQNPDFMNRNDTSTVIYNGDDSTSIFQAASLSKVVFAYIVLRMYERGEIDLDRPLYLYTDINRFTDKEAAKKLTARMILKHRSGLADWSASPSSDAWPTSPINFRNPVDSCFGYSGEAIAFLQRAVEAIKGEPIQKIAEKEVFIPLNMPHTAYEWIPCYDSLVVCGFNSKGENRGRREGLKANTAYTLRTNAREYARFLDELFYGKTLSKSTKKMMFDPGKERAVGEPDENRGCDEVMYWGLSIGIEKNAKHGKILWHWGDNGNFKALFIYICREHKRLVYFTNSANGHDIIDKITALFFNDPVPFAISSWIVGQ